MFDTALEIIWEKDKDVYESLQIQLVFWNKIQ